MNKRAKLRREEGAAAVEFALILGLLAILIFGMLEFGLAFWQVQNLRAAAREGARVAAVGGADGDIRAAMEEASVGSLSGGWGYSASTDCEVTPGDEVTIRINNGSLSGSVREAFEISIPFLPPMDIGNSIELSGTFRCE
jgi:hypothetical protein